MRRIVATLVVVACLAPATPAGAQEVFAEAGPNQWALGSWITNKDGKPHTIYFADALRTTDVQTASLVTYLAIAKGRCRSFKNMTFCTAMGRFYEREAEDFEFDPALRTASMRLETERRTHTASWVAEGPPEPFHHASPAVEDDITGAWAGVGVDVLADASANLYGTKLSSKKVGLAVLSEGVDVFALAWTDETGAKYELTRQVRGDRLRLTLRISR